ncbi:hypothetical protein FHT86_002157 [Rhizobium sp. BK313]|uniref:hypothetical protein n=1 Tax=Rhizobium sp. BK313 TaxID=2587081 RepID=UPI0016073FC2|nr:hypothetical protein [Rhizobium sp. BK313]MBB3453901.1 hypothetical protein [Rhizobium sp. BK313]
MADEAIPGAEQPTAAAVEAPVVAAPEAVVEAPAVETPAAPAEPNPHETPTLLEGFKDKPEVKAEEAKPAEEKPAEPGAEAKPAEVKPEEKPGEAKPAETPAADLPPITYEFKLPEALKDDSDKMGAYTGVLAEHRVPPEAGQKLLDMHATAMQSYAEQVAQNQMKVWNDTRADWRKQVMADEQLGGAGHQTAMGAIARMRDMFVSEKDMPAFDEFLRITGAGDHPAFLRMLHSAARHFDEPGMPPPNPKPSPSNGQAPKGRFRDAIYDHPRSGGSR